MISGDPGKSRLESLKIPIGTMNQRLPNHSPTIHQIWGEPLGIPSRVPQLVPPTAGLDVTCDVHFRGKKRSEVDRLEASAEVPICLVACSRKKHMMVDNY